MNLLELSELLLDEKKAEGYLLKVGILKTFTECEKCGSDRITKISRGRHRCNSCLSEWSNKKGSVLYNNNLSYSKFIGIVKLFEMDIEASVTSNELLLNRNTINSNYLMLRKITSNFSEKLESEYDSILKKSSPISSIKIDDNKVNIDVKEEGSLSASESSLVRTRVPSKEVSFLFDYKRISG